MTEPLRAAVLSAAVRTVESGLNHGTSGNVSARDGHRFVITPTGRAFKGLGPWDLAELTVDGGQAAPGPAPSSEWPLHRAVYQARNDAAAIIHTHSPAASAFACLARDLPAFHYMIAVAGGDSVRAAPYAPFGSPELGAAAVTALRGRFACFLAHHGLVAIGRSLDHALTVAAEVEFLADLYLRLLPAGEIPLLDAATIDDVVARFKRYQSESS